VVAKPELNAITVGELVQLLRKVDQKKNVWVGVCEACDFYFFSFMGPRVVCPNCGTEATVTRMKKFTTKKDKT